MSTSIDRGRRPAVRGAGEVFGHPRGLAVLFATEMWERFSYYGMQALLVLYMVNHLLQPERAGAVVAYGPVKTALEALFGPLSAQALASQVYGLYTGFVYLTPVFGGLLADRVLGQRRTVILGAVLMAAGHFMMAFERWFFAALLLLILGNGAFKPNISTQVGGLYAPGDPRRDRAYSIFYVGVNLGAFLAPLVCGTLGETAGWHYGFGAAGVGMLVGLAIYLSGSRLLPPEERRPVPSGRPTRRPLELDERRALAGLFLLCLALSLFWAAYEQQGNTIALWAEGHTDRAINLVVWSGEIPVTWFQAVNPLLIFAFTPLVVGLWSWQAERGREPSTGAKMALGCFGAALANLIMALAAYATDTGGKASWLWLLAYFVVLTLAELYVSPIGLSLASKVAPARLLSVTMGLWLGTNFLGNLAAGWLGGFWERMDKGPFFLMLALVAALAGVALWACYQPLRAVLKET
jgi:proton-dependent oligopeptide transporter, POT family